MVAINGYEYLDKQFEKKDDLAFQIKGTEDKRVNRLSLSTLSGAAFEDEKSRESRPIYKLDTLSGIDSFVRTFGWETLEKWGFNIHPSSHPLITKEQIKQLYFNEKFDGPFVNNGPLLGRSCVFSSENSVRLSPYFLFEMLDHAIFEKQDLQSIEELIVKHLWKHASFCDIYYLMSQLKKYNLITTPLMQTYANFFEENKDKINQLLAQQDQQLVAWDQALQSGSSIPETAFNTLQKEKYEESFSALMPEFRAYVKERHPKIEQDFIQTD